MGTSSSYNGPGKRPDLIPPWAREQVEGPPTPESDDTSPEAPTPPPAPDQTPVPSFWPALKRAAGRAAAAGVGGSSVGGLARGYVRALGGRRAAAAAAVSGASTGASLAGFLAFARDNGLVASLTARNVPALKADGPEAVLAAIADLLAPDGAEREEAVARAALMETFRDWCELHRDDPDIGLTDPDAMKELLGAYLTNYVIEKASEELGACIERRAADANDVHVFYDGFKDTLRAFIKLDLSGLDAGAINWQGEDGKAFIRRQLGNAYGLMEDTP